MQRQLLGVIVAVCLGGIADANDVTPSIVKIYTTYQKSSPSRPWQMEGAASKGGSGCIIENRLILTNAHVVSDHTFIQVRRAGSPDKFVAEVEAVSHELDLALLKVKDSAFFKDAKPLALGDLPHIGDPVVAYGFPTGGTRVTITRGVVSRTEMHRYSHSGHSNLACQIDAAINPGSSGGPVLDARGRIVGVAFQSQKGQNIAYMIPAPVVRHFFKDRADGTVDGAPILLGHWQYLQNASLRASLGMPKERSGVLMFGLEPRETTLKLGDVVLKIDGFDVGNDGTFELRPGERVAMEYATNRKQRGESVPLVIQRAGKVMEVELALTVTKQTYPYLVSRTQYEARPSYFIHGGLVFSRFTVNYSNEWGEWEDVPYRLRRHWYTKRTGANLWRKHVVVCIKVLPHALNAGYEWAEDYVIEKVNSKRIAELRDLVKAIEEHKGEFHLLEMEGGGLRVVLNRKDAAARSPEILKRYDVPSDRSADLR